MEQRLQKILSNYGVASRRKAEQMIMERRVAEGALQLGDLKPGQWRVLTEEELAKLP